MRTRSILVGDIGGTNARFAMGSADGSHYEHEQSYVCSKFESPEDAIRAYLHGIGVVAAPDVICLAVAGPVVDNAVSFTNSDWNLSECSLANAFGSECVRLLNDFEAAAHALPALDEIYVTSIGSVPPADLSADDFTVGVLGPGTGLGVAGLVRSKRKNSVLVTEGGHVGFAPETELQMQILESLRKRYDRVSDERLVSGAGLENIYWALSSGVVGSEPDAAEIFARYYAKTDQVAIAAVDVFFEVLGQVAGNIALTVGAFEGVYLAGGVAQRYPDILALGRFRSGFENKGRHSHIMKAIPTALISHPHPGLLGALVASQ